MTVWEYMEPGENGEHRVVRMTEHQIIAEYWTYWANQMRKAHKNHLINPRNCIDDWVVTHWAYKVSD